MTPVNRSRAGAACSHCHSRKSKCDAQKNGIPCSGCSQRGLADCRLLPTARGKYIRKPKIHGRNPDAQSGKSCIDPELGGSPEATNHAKPCSNPGTSQPQLVGHVGIPQEAGGAATGSPADLSSTPSDGSNQEESSWVDLFEAFLKTRRGENAIDKACITYLGESFPLTTVLEDFRNGSLQLHHPGPALPAPSPTTSDRGPHPPHLAKEDLSFLEAKHVFELPALALFNDLMTTFINNVYPLYPAVILQDFLIEWKTQSLPWVLCHALCFVGAAFCKLQILHAAGFRNRREALHHFYVKAKLLFDFGYERDKIILLQTVTLLTFWPSSPNDVWTFYHWIGFGVTLAESLGIHRSLSHLNMDQKDRSLLKRLWWILVIRDAFGAALFGRPVRINGSHCDVEHVLEEDFASDFEISCVQSSGYPLHAPYLAHVSKLAVILRDIISNRLTPVTEMEQTTERAATQVKLDEWRSEIPAKLDWDVNSASRNIYTATLSILYDNNLIFMNLQKPTSAHKSSVGDVSSITGLDDPMSNSQATQDAAERIVELAGSLVIKGSLNTMPHEVFTGVFMAEAVSFKKVFSVDRNIGKLGRAQVNSCQMIFNEVRGFWDPAEWVMQLFNGLLSKGEDSHPISQLESMPLMDDFIGFDFLNDMDTFIGDIHSLPVITPT